MGEFRSVHSYYAYANRVRNEWRYLRNAEQEEFLSTVLATRTNRVAIIPRRAIIYRAQEGCEWPPPAKDGLLYWGRVIPSLSMAHVRLAAHAPPDAIRPVTEHPPPSRGDDHVTDARTSTNRPVTSRR